MIKSRHTGIGLVTGAGLGIILGALGVVNLIVAIVAGAALGLIVGSMVRKG